MKFELYKALNSNETEVFNCIKNFETSGKLFADGKRNKIKLFTLDDSTINIKSFKIPNLLNQVIYKYFRKSKAKRSFEYATILKEKHIGTPQPIAFLENYNLIGLNSSYYVSEHLVAELTFKELVEVPDYPENEIILRQFTQFCFNLHEKGIEFLDHSPGNTLIKKVKNSKYNFFLVDLNRMKFHSEMNFETRMKNLCRLTPKKEMIAIMSEEYANLYSKEYQEVFDKMWQYTSEFQYKFFRKKRFKSKLKL